MKKHYRSLMCSGASMLALVGCAEVDDAKNFPKGQLELAVAPLSLPGIDEACYSLKVSNNSSGSSVVFSETGICSSNYGDGKGAITYIGACDAQADADGNAGNGVQNRVELVLENLS